MQSTSTNFYFNRIAITIALIAILTAIGSEIKIMPYENAPFRFGLGSIIFFLAVLIRTVPLIPTGIVTGVTVVIFRTLLDYVFSGTYFLVNFIEHLPAATYYFSFAFCLTIFNIEKYKNRPFALVLIASTFEVLSNIIEQLFTIIFVTQITISLEEVVILIVVAILRSLFVIGLFSSITMSEQKKQLQQLLNIGSNLYVETLYLQKSMEQIEQITANSFELYKHLSRIDPALSIKALQISQEIHEVKKDEERIFAGLSKIVASEQFDRYLMSDLLHFVTEANKKYSELQNKNVFIKVSLNEDFYTSHYFKLLAILNNLVANAVEAIQHSGNIKISVLTLENQTIKIVVEDDGIGIPANSLPIIFDPGFTTKFNSVGKPSTGIGLSHVHEIVTKLNGEIKVTSKSKTTFTIFIPNNKL